MATYRIQAPNGQTYTIEGPEGATDDQVRAEVMRQYPDAANAASQAAQELDGGTQSQPTSVDETGQHFDATNKPVGVPHAPNPVAEEYTGPADVGGAPTVRVFGDQITSEARGAPHLSLNPQQEREVIHILATAPIDKAAALARQKFQQYLPGFGDNFDKIIDQRRKTGRVPGQFNYPQPVTPQASRTGSVVKGAAHSATLGADNKVLSAVDAASKSLGLNGGQSYDYGSFGNNFAAALDRGEAYDTAAQQQHPFYYGAGELAGAAVLPTGIAAAADRAGYEAGAMALRSGATQAEARMAANVAVRRAIVAQGAKEGAGYGAGAGALSADNPQDALTGGITGGVAGGVLGGATGLAASRLGSPTMGAAARNAIPAAEDVMAAADRQGIDLLPADVGGPTTRRLTAAAAQAPLSASPIINAGQKMVGQAQSARDRIAAEIGQALDPEAAGLSIRSGAQRYIADSGADVRAAYNAAEKAAGDTLVPPTQAVAALDKNIGELSQTPGGAPALERMQALRDELAAGDVSPAGLLRMRTVLRDQFMNDGLVGSDTERRIGQVLDAANNDVADGLRAAGKGQAASLYTAAAAKYKTRQDTIRQVLKPLIGTRESPRAGEAVAKTLMADLQGNNARAVRLLNTLPPEEQATTRASVIGGLGNASAGAQNANGTAFSLPVFLTNWNKIGETAKRAYFGLESRAALNDLAKVADATKQAQGYANRSNTGGAVLGNLSLLAAGATQSPVASAIGGVTQLVGGKLLASPRFARVLARYSRGRMDNSTFIEKLGRIAKAEPQIANDLFGLQTRIRDAITGTPMRAAANEGGNSSSVANGGAGQPNSDADYDALANDMFATPPQELDNPVHSTIDAYPDYNQDETYNEMVQ